MEKLVKLNLLGDLGEKVGKSWEFSAKSAQECIHALNTVTRNKFNNYFINNDKLKAKYRVIINGRDFVSPVSELNEGNLEMAYQSELVMKHENLQTIDIVPFIENNDSKTIGIILGVILIVVGVILIFYSSAYGVAAGIALITAGIGIGIAALLSKPPDFGDPNRPDKAGKQSYLFGGPINIIGEGGPVPIAFGQILAGSQVISSAYKIQDYVPNR